MNENIEQSTEIIQRAITELQPYAIIAMVSGGDDSLTTYHVARQVGIKLDAILHINTGTGIPETTEFVRKVGEEAPEKYLEASAGKAYEDYVLRKGFFGRGHIGHTYAYHLLKAEHFRRVISREFRQRKRGRNILLINGARQAESNNRMFTMREAIQRENKGSRNYWVNIINHWTKPECHAFLGELGITRNPVAEKLCRSGECMCGTMQSHEERQEAAFWYPQWGQWLDSLEKQVMVKYPWGWGENIPKWLAQEKQGQLRLPGFQPMCTDC